MKTSLTSFYRLSVRSAFVAAVLLACAPGTVKAHRNPSRVNKYGAPVVDANGHHISYDQKHLEALARTLGSKKGTNVTARPKSSMVKASGFVPTGGQTQQPFWQYAVFGAGIGLSNIIIGPTPPGGAPEILIGGDVQSGGDDFWQSIRYNTKSGTYDNVFVSPLYTPRGGDPYVAIARIGLAHVTNASDQQIVVMLEDGRIYLYDFATKTQVGFLDSGPFPFGSGLQGLSLTDLDDDGFAELIITTAADLYVFNGSGQLLWQVPGAGGVDVVAGRMDDDASLKIAATNGKVVDAVTHGVVWNYANGFGVRLKLAPFPGETYEQLISAEAWQFVYSYDVGRQLPRWSIPTPQDIGAIEVADLDNDGIPEVIIGDGQWGTVHVHDLITQALKWSVNNPDHGVTNIAVGDADNDGAVELLWGAGWTDTGPDHLYVASTTGGHDIEWQNLDLWAPFVGPAIGDLDGDGHPELVICSQGSELIDSGRILVFDLGTLALRAISQPILDGFAVYGVGDLKLRDVEGNGRLQIVIGTDSIYDGVIVVYRFDSNNTFTSIWTNSTLPQGSPIKFVEVADLDNNGTLKIIGGNYDAFGNGVYVYAYDYPSGVQSWQSVNLANSNSVAGLMVQDLDGNGSKEISALTDSGDLYTWDGPTRQLRDLRQATSGTVLSDRATLAGLVLGDTSGVGHFWQWANNSYTETFTRQLSTECDPFFGCFNGINVAPDDSLWTGFGSTLNQRLAPSYDSVVWQSPGIGDGFGRFVATAARNGQNCVFSSARHAVMGLTYGPAGTPTPTPTPTASPSPTPTATGTPSPTATPTLTPTPRQTGTPRPRPTPAPRP